VVKRLWAQRRERYASSLSILLLDVDNFKQFNDTHGHDGGDTVLQNVAATLRPSIFYEEKKSTTQRTPLGIFSSGLSRISRTP
jgi:diguanylate cyclase (GGDEF)-like protein